MKPRTYRAGRYERPDYSALFSREQLAAMQSPERLRKTRALWRKARNTRRGAAADAQQEPKQ